MSLPHPFVLRIAEAIGDPGALSAKMVLVLMRPYAHLEGDMRREFDGQDDVEVVVDRRFGERRIGERRKGGPPLLSERRQADRRRETEEVLQIILSA